MILAYDPGGTEFAAHLNQRWLIDKAPPFA